MSERTRTRARIRNVTQRVTRRACLLRPFNYSNRYRSRLAPAPANSRDEETAEEGGRGEGEGEEDGPEMKDDARKMHSRIRAYACKARLFIPRIGSRERNRFKRIRLIDQTDSAVHLSVVLSRARARARLTTRVKQLPRSS
jgi:hypothetical protein